MNREKQAFLQASVDAMLAGAALNKARLALHQSNLAYVEAGNKHKEALEKARLAREALEDYLTK